ncbi:MAG: nitroreductase family protein [Bacteroidota bacterium]
MEFDINNNPVLAIIFQRKSVRNFTGGEVSDEQLQMLLKAAMAAPSAVNQQPWEFVVVRDRHILDCLADELPYAKMLYKASAAVIVCGNPEKAHLKLTEYAVIDATLASQNMLLAAESLGLGAIWTAAYPYDDRIAIVRKYTGIPKNIIPLNVIPVGIPVGVDKPKEKFDQSKIHHGKW